LLTTPVSKTFTLELFSTAKLPTDIGGKMLLSEQQYLPLELMVEPEVQGVMS
jgi:hypothetical protein